MPGEVLKSEVVGVIPAGGQAVRLAPLPCSKELYPVGFRAAQAGSGARPRVVSHYLLEEMKLAGISKAYVVLRPGKWDIPTYYGDGSMLDMQLAYLMLGRPFGVPFTVDQAYPFVRHATVAFGFPDILFEADQGFAKLLARQCASQADIVLGLFVAAHPFSTEDRIVLNHGGQVHEIILRPAESSLRYSWAIAVWNPNFTEFLHEYARNAAVIADQAAELSAGHAIQAAIRTGLKVAGLVLNDEKPYLDIGTPEGLREAIERGLKAG
jgi:glucose-1-phosphate thymidylyltransferase